jgi:methyl-accepting chemotaxis protein
MRLSVRWALWTILGLLGAGLIGGSWWSQQKLAETAASLDKVYLDRVVPLQGLKAISDAYAVLVVDASHKARNGNVTWTEAAQSVAAAEADIRRLWQAYLATTLTPEEADLVEEVKERFAPADAAIAELKAILASGDEARLVAFTRDRLYQTIDPVTESVGKLIDLQVRVAGEANDAAKAAYAVTARNGTISEVLAIVLVLAGVLVVQFAVLRPLGGLAAAMRRFGEGDADAPVPGTGWRTEIGEMARNFVAMRDGLVAAERAKIEALRAMADRVESECATVVGRVAERARELEQAAGDIARSAGLVDDRSREVLDLSGETMGSVNTVASASVQLSASIQEISQQAQNALGMAERVGDVGQHVRTTIGELSEAVGRIGEVTRLIEEIAEQTNLLALNATIEAARAGDAGRGFAVVAGEVKQLAGNTAKATQEISQQIQSVASVTQSAVEAVARIAAIIDEMRGVNGAIASAVEEQSAATGEISQSVTNVARHVETVAERMREVAAHAKGNTEQSGGMRDASAELSALVASLGTALNRIVRTSTADVDRRSHARHEGSWPCTIRAAGQTIAARITNISVAGAEISGWSGGAAGTRLEIEGTCLEGCATASVASVTDGTVRILFDREVALKGIRAAA